ncbi:uncharacterized protein TNCV_2972161 [Trichonephila clavipes]|nr:uncharacterized protein TNCV_2972161 [Trichonephila clavipes]
MKTKHDVSNDFRAIIDNDNFVPKIPQYLKRFTRISSEISERIEEKQDQRKTCYKKKTPFRSPISSRNPEEELLRIVKASAAIIREDIRSSVVETKSYPPPSKMLIMKNQEIPKGLLHFLQEVIMKKRKGKIANSKTKRTSISYAIMAALRERSFSSQLLLSLSVFLHKRYGSERQIDVLYSLGFESSYGKTVQYEISTAYHPQPRILSSESALEKYSATICWRQCQYKLRECHTLDGNNTFHIMGMIKIVTPKDIY